VTAAATTTASNAPALIAAASVLGGVMLTSTFNMLKGRQERKDKEAEREEQRRILHRSARKEAYAALLTSYAEADVALDEFGLLRPSAHPATGLAPEVVRAKNAVLAFRSAVAAVVLEGPAEVGNAARNLQSSCGICLTVRLIAVNDHPNSDMPVAQLMTPNVPGVVNQDQMRQERHDAFVAAAREALGGDAPGF
jgi:hypothetical protein